MDSVQGVRTHPTTGMQTLYFRNGDKSNGCWYYGTEQQFMSRQPAWRLMHETLMKPRLILASPATNFVVFPDAEHVNEFLDWIDRAQTTNVPKTFAHTFLGYAGVRQTMTFRTTVDGANTSRPQLHIFDEDGSTEDLALDRTFLDTLRYDLLQLCPANHNLFSNNGRHMAAKLQGLLHDSVDAPTKMPSQTIALPQRLFAPRS